MTVTADESHEKKIYTERTSRTWSELLPGSVTRVVITPDAAAVQDLNPVPIPLRPGPARSLNHSTKYLRTRVTVYYPDTTRVPQNMYI